MTEFDTTKIFESLPLPQRSSVSSCSFSALPFSPNSAHKIGKDEGGCPCLLIATETAGETPPRVPLVLENLAVLFDLRCQVSSPAGPVQTGTFTVLKCVSADMMVRSYFLSLLPGISAAIGRAGDRATIAVVIEDLVELFRALSAAPRKEIQGLWGELLLINEGKTPQVLAGAWHVRPEDCYDFNEGPERVEVKTTSQTPRRHHFTLEQLRPPGNTRLVVASLLVHRSGAGSSVFDLLEAVRQKIVGQPQLELRLIRQAHQTLGNAWQSARHIRFDYEAARQSLRYYMSDQIPQVPLPLPEGISHVSFVADMDRVQSATASELRDSGVLFRGLPSASKISISP